MTNNIFQNKITKIVIVGYFKYCCKNSQMMLEWDYGKCQILHWECGN